MSPTEDTETNCCSDSPIGFRWSRSWKMHRDRRSVHDAARRNRLETLFGDERHMAHDRDAELSNNIFRLSKAAIGHLNQVPQYQSREGSEKAAQTPCRSHKIFAAGAIMSQGVTAVDHQRSGSRPANSANALPVDAAGSFCFSSAKSCRFGRGCQSGSCRVFKLSQKVFLMTQFS